MWFGGSSAFAAILAFSSWALSLVILEGALHTIARPFRWSDDVHETLFTAVWGILFVVGVRSALQGRDGMSADFPR